MKNKILLFLLLGSLSTITTAQENYFWDFSYEMKIKSIQFKTESNDRNDFLKDQLKNILKESHQICVGDEKELKKAVKKLFPGCNFYYEQDENKFTSNISCDNLDYSIALNPKNKNDFRGNISVESNNDEFQLKAAGNLTLKRGKACNQ